MAVNLTHKQIKDIDKSNMFETLELFPKQVKEAIKIGKNFSGFIEKVKSNRFLILGMGGSAIGGDLLKSYLTNLPGNTIEIQTIRGYDIPSYVDESFNVIASSYSGGTEETISAFKQAFYRGLNCICISTGGELSSIAEKNDIPVIKIPSGLQPRCAVGYSFFPMLIAIKNAAYISEELKSIIESNLSEIGKKLKKLSKSYTQLDDSNQPLSLAGKMDNRIPVIYASAAIMDSVAVRWVRQIQENAKYLAFSGLLPEMNHNEINSFSNPKELIEKFALILLKDKSDHQRTKIRFDALNELLSDSISDIYELETEDDSLLSRIFHFLYLGDWFSYYLSVLNGIDPTPIPIITKLKNILSNK